MATATLKNYRQSPRKVRKVADLIRGKNVNEALKILDFTVKRSANPIKTLLLSAIANAKVAGESAENLSVAELRVDKGMVLKRMMPRARGRGFPIHKHTSHIKIILGAGKVAKKGRIAKTKAVKK